MPREASGVDVAGCPRLVIESETCGQMYRGEKHYRTIDERTWDAKRRILDMDERNVRAPSHLADPRVLFV